MLYSYDLCVRVRPKNEVRDLSKVRGRTMSPAWYHDTGYQKACSSPGLNLTFQVVPGLLKSHDDVLWDEDV